MIILKPNPTKSTAKPIKFTNFLEIHPVIKEFKFLLTPKSLLDPSLDTFEFKETNPLVRGGEPYYEPIGWIRYGLNIKLAYKDFSHMKWCTEDNNAEEWAIVYHGFNLNPLKQLYSKLFDKTNNINPTLRPSRNLNFANLLDTNKKSTGFNSGCGLGILCSPRADLAEEHTTPCTLNDRKYKLLLQCRSNPTKIRIPKSQPNIRIINSPEHIRPYAILIKEI